MHVISACVLTVFLLGAAVAGEAPGLLTSPCEGGFLRGDANGDLVVDISDPIFALAGQFQIGLDYEEICADACDADDNGRIEITDPIFILAFLFLGTAEPPAPGAYFRGPDPTFDMLPNGLPEPAGPGAVVATDDSSEGTSNCDIPGFEPLDPIWPQDKYGNSPTAEVLQWSDFGCFPSVNKCSSQWLEVDVRATGSGMGGDLSKHNMDLFHVTWKVTVTSTAKSLCDPDGAFSVPPECFGVDTHKVQLLNGAKIVMQDERGHKVKGTADEVTVEGLPVDGWNDIVRPVDEQQPQTLLTASYKWTEDCKFNGESPVESEEFEIVAKYRYDSFPGGNADFKDSGTYTIDKITSPRFRAEITHQGMPVVDEDLIEVDVRLVKIEAFFDQG